MEAAAYIGFGEAGAAFARPGARAFDLKPDKVAAHAAAGVQGCRSAAEALAGAAVVLCLVTADQALAAAQAYAAHLKPGALWLDMNSVAPETKRHAARVVEAAGGRYVDVAVMSPVQPARFAAPLLVCGPHAVTAAEALAGLGFSQVRAVAGGIGAGSAIKMIRSVMVKGLEALSAECALAARAAGVEAEVIASLDASWKTQGWAERIDYNLDRMLVHGFRRAAEMEEVVKTLEDLGVGGGMSRVTAQRQRQIGALGRGAPKGLDAKLSLILGEKARAA